MGWPLAVSAALMDRRRAASSRRSLRWRAGICWPWRRSCFRSPRSCSWPNGSARSRSGRRCLVIALGVYLLINRRHPRFLARVPPSRLALWSFLAAMAHGAGLMLVPIYLGICRTVETDAGHAAAADLMVGNARIAVSVALAHTLAMTLSGGASPGASTAGWACGSCREAGSTSISSGR
jgi:hypothetical protein